ncbi:helix-turn-helix domain-containing protein [Xanthobacter pseudotagetidis]|uniref:helix-turn-helix domain-containing protein n=1 Tax=Xanthobacter pseudotagetidis TaxID=3119911 RepID=UPI00372AAA1B
MSGPAGDPPGAACGTAAAGAGAAPPIRGTRAPPPPPADARLLRRLYEEGVPLTEIARRTGHGRDTLYRWIDRIVADDGTVVFAPVPRRRSAAGARTAARAGAAPTRARLMARLWHAAERQVALIEARIPALGEDAGCDTEKDARALAILARTLRELAALEDATRARRAGRGRPAPGASAAMEGEGDGTEFRDLDAFRSELARRLDGLRADGAGAEPAAKPV